MYRILYPPEDAEPDEPPASEDAIAYQQSLYDQGLPFDEIRKRMAARKARR